MIPPILRLLIHKNEATKSWVAECVDFDMVSQASTLEDLPQAFGHVFYGTLLVALEHGEPPVLRPAPADVVKRWEKISSGQPELVKLRSWKNLVPSWVPEAFTRLIRDQERLPKCDQPEQLLFAAEPTPA